jgi:hypothetical protein
VILCWTSSHSMERLRKVLLHMTRTQTSPGNCCDGHFSGLFQHMVCPKMRSVHQGLSLLLCNNMHPWIESMGCRSTWTFYVVTISVVATEVLHLWHSRLLKELRGQWKTPTRVLK